MRKLFLPLAALAMLGLAACGQKARNEAAEANEAVPGDSNTMGAAVDTVNQAEDAAFNHAEQLADNGAPVDESNSSEIFD